MRNWKTKVKVQLGNSAARSLDHLQSFSFLISKMGAIMPADCCCFQDAVGQWTCKHLRVYKFQCTWEKLSPSSGPGISSCFNKIANSFYVCWGQVPISLLQRRGHSWLLLLPPYSCLKKKKKKRRVQLIVENLKSIRPYFKEQEGWLLHFTSI